MKVNSDYRDLLLSLNEASVRYLVVGGYAWMVHQEPRYTKDLDVWIEAVPANAEALLSALQGKRQRKPSVPAFSLVMK